MRTKNKQPLSPERRRLRRFGVVVAACFVLGSLLGYGGFYWASHAGRGALVSAEGNPVGGNFRVASMGGSIVTEGEFRGSWLIVWFVDPRCPAQRCMPALKRLDSVAARLHQEGHSVSPLVVSLDATAPNTDDLQDYVMNNAPHTVPAYASQSMIEAMTDLYHAPLTKEDGYYIPAPSFVVMSPQGRYAASVPTALDEESLMRRLHAVITP
ncbi:SCO family protein [Saccharibacter floricola]|nr:SCO family protein [Saccharibacter floricola]